MALIGNPEEVWAFINFLYNVRDDIQEFVEKDLHKGEETKKRLLAGSQSKEAVALSEDLTHRMAILSKAQAVNAKSIGRAIRGLHKFLNYLEDLDPSNGGQVGDTNTYRGISFRNFDSFDATEENIDRMRNGNAPIGRDGLYVQLHHSMQTENGPIWALEGSKHTRWKTPLHINPPSIPSGINRQAFNMLKKDYWKWFARRFR